MRTRIDDHVDGVHETVFKRDDVLRKQVRERFRIQCLPHRCVEHLLRPDTGMRNLNFRLQIEDYLQEDDDFGES